MNWLLLHGLGRTREHWLDVVEIWERLCPGHRFFALDNPGFGSARAEGAPATVEGMCESLRKRWERLRIERGEGAEWGVIGHSLGGMVALHWAGAWRPRDFSRVVVLNTSDADSGAVTDRLRKRAWPQVLPILTSPDARARERRLYELALSKLPASARRELAIRSAAASPRGLTRWAVLQQIRAALVFRAPEHFDLPLLILAGQLDRIVRPTCSHRLAERYGLEAHVHPEAGHFLHCDATEWVARELVAFAAGSTD